MVKASILAIYSRHNGEKVQEPTEIAHRALSVAISRDGMQIAVGFDEILRFYSVQDGSCDEFDLPKPKHHLPKAPSVDSQCMSFSSDAVRLVVATRYFENGDVYAGIYEKDSSPRTRYFKAESMPSVGETLSSQLSLVAASRYGNKLTWPTEIPQGLPPIINCVTPGVRFHTLMCLHRSEPYHCLPSAITRQGRNTQAH